MNRTNLFQIQLLVRFLLAALFIGISMKATADAMPAGNAVRGKTHYQGCEACRSVDDNGLGPRNPVPT